MKFIVKAYSFQRGTTEMRNLVASPCNELGQLLVKFKKMYLSNSRFSKKSSGKAESKDSNRFFLFIVLLSLIHLKCRDYKALHYCEVVFQWMKVAFSPNEDLTLQVLYFLWIFTLFIEFHVGCYAKSERNWLEGYWISWPCLIRKSESWEGHKAVCSINPNFCNGRVHLFIWVLRLFHFR